MQQFHCYSTYYYFVLLLFNYAFYYENKTVAKYPHFETNNCGRD